jgi:hypothetical protein
LKQQLRGNLLSMAVVAAAVALGVFRVNPHARQSEVLLETLVVTLGFTFWGCTFPLICVLSGFEYNRNHNESSRKVSLGHAVT